jgi:Flp pilus assembly protein TadB
LLERIGLGGLVWSRVRRDLAVLERSAEVHLAEKAALGIFGAVLIPLAAILLALGGVSLPLVIPLWGAILLGVAFFFLPDLAVHHDARSRRRDFRHALGAFLDLVVIDLAGGGGVETALADAVSVGDSWSFTRLRRAIDEARLSREPPWDALGRLGTELGVAELGELAASVALAGTEGAKVRSSLAAKATSIRAHELAESEAEDQATTERMSLPVVLLFAGFLLFVGFAAVEHVLAGL